MGRRSGIGKDFKNRPGDLGKIRGQFAGGKGFGGTCLGINHDHHPGLVVAGQDRRAKLPDVDHRENQEQRKDFHGKA
jgi:hypothetical protein